MLNGLTANAKEQINIITNHFKTVFHVDSEKEIPEVKPKEMEVPFNIHEGIAKLLNHRAKTGDYQKELKTGILILLPKPGKKQGPPQNLRPIILLSVLRKILAIIMITRTAEKLNSRIPLSQAA